MSTSINTCYFTCTLGQAQTCGHKRQKILTVNDFLDEQNDEVPLLPSTAFPHPQKSGKWTASVLTFAELRQRSIEKAQYIHANSSSEGKASRNAALLCSSSEDFVFSWLGLMRLGYSVLLIAPQCQPAAIAHLCKECGVSLFLYDQAHTTLAEQTGQLLEKVQFMLVERTGVDSDETTNASACQDLPPLSFPISDTDTAYWHHTSGTSTGLPKPIAQSHRGAVGVLPRLEGRGAATFTTTPLYHGGIADCFRAWTSAALIWLFPGKDVPITASNMLKSLDIAAESVKRLATPPVKYFSSVPYVLQMLASEAEGMKVLQKMDIVGVGGAALHPSVGDSFVQKGLKLVSRYGSAECGFLMSSHRDYSKDKEWQYLRSHNSPLLRFELQDNGLAELVITKDWPHMAKRNRKDGSFATSDLFEAHPTIPHAWRYHSRADSQLTLITGKKFDPAPLEAAIATSRYLDDALVFGNGQQYPGALLFRSSSSSDLSDEVLLDKVWPEVEKLNSEGQGHTKLSRSMLTVMSDDTAGLEKSSKGTVLRRQAEERFSTAIEEAYQGGDVAVNGIEAPDIPDDKVPITILDIIKAVQGSTDAIPDDADLFACGIDSVACMQIRAQLQQLVPSGAPALPLNVVYDCGCIKGLTKYIKSIRNGQVAQQEDEEQLMPELVEKYSTFDDQQPKAGSEGHFSDHRDEVVILTGATGALGAHILHQLRTSPSPPSQIICLVRGSSPHAAHERVSKSLTSRLKPPLPAFNPTSPLLASSSTNGTTSPSHSTPETPTITVLPTTLFSPTLGLDPKTYSSLANKVKKIIHCAWAVNFSTRLRSFERDHIAGLHHLLQFCLSSSSALPPRLIFCSSTASVTSTPTTPISEKVSHNPTTSSPLGYSRSKWTAEQILSRAHTNTRLKNHIAILRIGQLCGDTEEGVWNASEAWPLMLSCAQLEGLDALPRLEGEGVGWLGVDAAARAVLEVAGARWVGGIDGGYEIGGENGEVPVFHILNPDTSRTWDDLLLWMQRLVPSITILSAREWVEKLENFEGEAAKHPARKLLGLWRSAYCSERTEDSVREGRVDEDEEGRERDKEGIKRNMVTGPIFSIEKAKTVAPSLRDVGPVSEEHFGKMWYWIERNVGVEDGEKD